MNPEAVKSGLEVAKGLSDYGALIMMGAVYLLLSASMMIAVFRWFRSLIDRIVEQQAVLDSITGGITANNHLLGRIAEGLSPETQLRIRNLTGFAFDYSVEQVCRLIKKIREENHIADKAATGAKIRKLLQVIHDDRNARFDPFTYAGRPLSDFCPNDWVEQVAQVVETEIYNPDGPNNGRAYTNVSLAYGNIKTDFYKRLNG